MTDILLNKPTLEVFHDEVRKDMMALSLVKSTEEARRSGPILEDGPCSVSSTDSSAQSNGGITYTPAYTHSKRKHIEIWIGEQRDSASKKVCMGSPLPALPREIIYEHDNRKTPSGCGKRPWQDDDLADAEQAHRKKRSLDIPDANPLKSLSSVSIESLTIKEDATETWKARTYAKLDGMLQRLNESQRRSLEILKMLESVA